MCKIMPTAAKVIKRMDFKITGFTCSEKLLNTRFANFWLLNILHVVLSLWSLAYFCPGGPAAIHSAFDCVYSSCIYTGTVLDKFRGTELPPDLLIENGTILTMSIDMTRRMSFTAQPSVSSPGKLVDPPPWYQRTFSYFREICKALSLYYTISLFWVWCLILHQFGPTCEPIAWGQTTSMLMSIPQSIILEIPEALSQWRHKRFWPEYFWKFQWKIALLECC
mgnify:CR=1 FL=1